MLNVVLFNSVVTKVSGPKLGAIKKKKKNIQRLKQRGPNNYTSIYTLSDLGDSSNLIGSLSRTML